jgi:LruC domain-containing protein
MNLKFFGKMKRVFFYLSAILALVTACVSHDDTDLSTNDTSEYTNVKSLFDFSTVQDVNLTIDYSSASPVGPVFFSVYAENPYDGMNFDESITPLYQNYTNANGRFNEMIKLPAFAKTLYVYTGDFFIAENLMEANVTDGTALATIDGGQAAANKAPKRASRRAGVQTNSLENLYQLSYEVDWRTGDKTGVQVYKEWVTPLGTWDSESGRPSYLLDSSDPDYAKLAFNEDEMKGIYQSVAGALVRKTTCPNEYRQPVDLVMEKDAEVAVTVVGGNSCWNSSIGYYYFMEGEEPTSLMDLNIIMLFPNTQDGHSQFVKKKGNNFYGNIGLERGDVVKLMYYPNIASGDLSDATSIFPQGMKIGFIIKPNAWGMQKPQGDKVYYNSYKGEIKGATIGRQYNAWGASTNGMSYCKVDAEQCAADDGIVLRQNPNGESRSAKFAYENADGQQYAILTFEDACNDEDYGDIVLALKPVGVFKKLPRVKPRVTTTTGVYAYEDLWPKAGDYDMNDAVVDFQEDRELSILEWGGDYVITKQTFSLTTYQNYVELKSGLALMLDGTETPSEVVMKKISPDKTDTTEVEFVQDGNVYLLTDNIHKEVNTTYVLELNYENGITTANAASIKPFIYRDEENDKRWEVHIPFEAPSDKMNYSYFGTQDDRSVPEKGRFYVGYTDYPFAFFLSGVTVKWFTNTILLKENEKVPISELYPEFLEWSTSKGTKCKDWYKHPKK